MALNELVEAVYWYTDIDPEWNIPQTPEAQKKRAAMDAAAQKLALKLVKRSFSREELDLIFDWERR